MINRTTISSAARLWINTPFHPQGRRIGIGVDCLGLIIGVANHLKLKSLQGRDLSCYDTCIYNVGVPCAELMLSTLPMHFIKIDNPEPGAILSCINSSQYGHLGIISSDNTFIHACMLRGKVVEERIPVLTNNSSWRFAQKA